MSRPGIGAQRPGTEHRVRPKPRMVSVVIPTYNAVDTLGAQLDALAHQDYDGAFEVVISDNGSTDGLAEFISRRTQRMPVRVVDASERRGVSHARNVGCRESRGDLIVICDADDVVVTGWLRALVAVAAKAECVGGSLDATMLNDASSIAWRFPHRADQLPVKLRFLPYAHGCNVAVWRDVVEALGGWEETYQGGGEDVDFCWRLQLEGGRLAVAPDAVVNYRHRERAGGLARQMAGYAQADVLLYKRFREHGARRRSIPTAISDLWWLLSRLPLLNRRDVRGLWANRWGQLRGRVVGSLRYRIFYP